MIKTVVFDTNNFNKLWIKNSYGLLLGEKQDNKLNIFLPLECPFDTSLLISDQILQNISAKWVSKHFLNVFRMLPGNIQTVGCYCVCNHQLFTEGQKNILSILNSLWSKENKFNSDLFELKYHDKIFVLIDPISFKFLCKKINFKDETSVFRNVEIKYSNVLSEYITVQSNIVIRIDTIMSSEHNKDLILKQLKDSVNPFINDFITKATMLVNGEEMQDEMKLNMFDLDIEYDKNLNCGDISNDQFVPVQNLSKLDLMFVGDSIQPNIDVSFESDNENEFEIINRVKIQGRIPGIAFMSFQSSIKEVEIALKKDLVRSIYSRLELLTEELHITGGEMEVSQILLPQRVKVSLPFCSQFPLSDYKFISETATDVIARVRYFCRPPGVSDEELDINCIDTNIERSEQTSLEDEFSEAELIEEHELSTKSFNRTDGILYFIGLTALVLCISIVVYYILN